MKDYYYILGLPNTATTEEIRKAYRKLSTKFHPDKNNGDKFFEELFKEIKEAHDFLIEKNMLVCPRCMGKGYIDDTDINRLNRNNYWLSGSCLYCKGTGKVEKSFADKVDVADMFYGRNISNDRLKEIEKLRKQGLDDLSITKIFEAQQKLINSILQRVTK